MISATELKLTGNVSILAGLLGQGTATLDLNWGTGVYSISGSFSMYDNLISFGGSLTFDNSGDIDLVASASVNVPSIIPFYRRHLASPTSTSRCTSSTTAIGPIPTSPSGPT